MVEVQRAKPSQWEAVRATRLRALGDSPAAFGSTLAREVGVDDEEWRRRIASGDWFLAWVEGRPVGIAADFAEDGLPDERHLVAMWVEPDQRGTTVAPSLVDAVCRSARAQGATAVTLWVADGNVRARRFYERLGFRSTGGRQPLPSAPEIGEERLRLPLGHVARE